MKLHQKLLLSTALVSVCCTVTPMSALAQTITINAGETHTTSSDGAIQNKDVSLDGTLNIDDGFNTYVTDLEGSGTLNIEQNNGFEVSKGGFGVSIFSGTVTGAGELLVSGLGSLELRGNNTFTGITNIDQLLILLGTNQSAYYGISSFGHLAATTNTLLNSPTVVNNGIFETYTNTIGSISGTGEIRIYGGETLSFGSDNSSTAVSGDVNFRPNNPTNCNLTKLGTGTFTHTGNITCTGTITASGGTLSLAGTSQATSYQVDAGATLIGATGINILDTAMLAINGTYEVDASDSVGSVSGSGTIDIATGQTLNTGGDDSSTTFSGTVSGDGALTKSGTGTFTLSGNNTYSGGTNVAGGTLALEHSNAAGTGTITTTGSVIDYADGIDVSNAINVNSNTTQLQVNTGSATQSGVISETSGPRPLEKIGAGSLTLSGNNTYTGATNVSAGTLALSGSNQSTSYQVNSGATLQGLSGVDILDTAALTVSGTYDVDASDTIGSVSGTGSIDIATGQTLSAGAANSSTTFSGIISGDGGITKVGTGTLTLHGDNTYTGKTTVSAGTLSLSESQQSTSYQIDAGATLQGNSSQPSVFSVDFLDTAAFIVNGTFDLDSDETIGSISGSGTIDLTSGRSLSVGADNTDTTFSGTLTGSGSFGKSGTGTLTLTGNSSAFTGQTFINDGRLHIANNNALGSNIINGNGGTLLLDDNLSLSNTINIVNNHGIGTELFIEVDTNEQATFTGRLSGFGAFEKIGNGTLTLSGTNTFAGDASVNGGTLAITSNLGGDIDVNSGGILDATGTLTGLTSINSGGTLKGTGTLANVNILSGGTFAPGASIGTINTDNLTLNSGSTLEIEVDENGNSDVVNVDGTVSLGGSTLDINGAAGTYTGAPYNYTFITNDGSDTVTGAFGTITDDLAFLEASVDYTGGDGNDVVLTLTELSNFVIAGTPQNQQNVGQALGNIDRTSGSEGEALMQQIVKLTNEQAKQTYNDLSGDIHPSSTHNMFDVGGNVGGQIGGRFTNISGGGVGAGNNGFGYTAALETLNSNTTNGSYFSTDLATQNEVSSEQEFSYGYTPVLIDEKVQLWGGISGYYANVEGDGNAQGTVSSGYGAVFGGDRTSGSQTWGAAFGYAKTTTLTHDSLSELGMNSYSGAIYTQQELGDFNFNALAAYTYHQIDGKRTISNINATALSDYFAHQFTLQGELGRTFTDDHNKDITPYVLGRYMNLSTSAYSETGAGAANLISSGENFWSLDLVLGLRMDVELNEDTKLSFGAGYSYRFGDNQPETTRSFAGGGTFTTQSVARNRHSAFLEAGIEKAFSDSATFFAKANAELTNTHQSIGGNIGFKVRF